VQAEAVGAEGGAAATDSTTAGTDGSWSLSLPSNFGSTTITVTATSGDSTGYAQLSVTDLTLTGTTVLAVPDPTGDDNGPGTYGYPTDSDFQPGAFDLTATKVVQNANTVYLQVSLANLDPTFGSAFGAQLLDVYVRDPTAASTSTQAAFPSRNYTIAPADAWSERIEAQGFANVVWVNAAGDSLGSAQLVVDAASKTATVVLPKATFGTVGPGWSFTITLTGQDGFSSDQARAFTATPGAFTFGVCTTGETSPICAVDPSTVPKVVDTIPPPGVLQSDELNPIPGPVVLQGLTVGP
jgi:glucoamylase